MHTFYPEQTPARRLADITLKVLAKLANTAWQTLLFVSVSLAMDKKVNLI